MSTLLILSLDGDLPRMFSIHGNFRGRRKNFQIQEKSIVMPVGDIMTFEVAFSAVGFFAYPSSLRMSLFACEWPR